MADHATSPHPELPDASKWVVGVDGSDCSHHAALWAAANAGGRASELQLASTWSVPVSAAMSPMSSLVSDSTINAIEQATISAVTDLASRLETSSSVPVTTSVAHGGAAQLLLDAASHSSLLVVGSRGRGGFARLVLGSTSTQCATHSPTPVAVIPATASAARPRSIVVAFDGSQHALAALRWTVDFADPGSTIECVSAWDTTPIVVGADQLYFPEASDLARERLAQLMAEIVSASPRTDIDVQHVFLEGRPRPTLADRAAESDLLVFGARGHGAIGAAILGSVSSWLLHHAGTAMVVVPQPSTDDEVDDLSETPED
jgi:nucleotide-binding universal stress UspA family protein